MRETFDLSVPNSVKNSNPGFLRSYDSYHMDNTYHPYRQSLGNNRENTQSAQTSKHRFLETESLPQNLQPVSTMQHYTSILNHTAKSSSSGMNMPLKVAKIDIPKSKTSKTSTVRFCSSKKSKRNSKSRSKKNLNSSSKISTRLFNNQATHSNDSRSKSNKKNDKENVKIIDETYELLRKYENDKRTNKSVLTEGDKLLLTNNGNSLASFHPHEYSGGYDSLNNSSQDLNEIRPYTAHTETHTSKAISPHYINLVDQENGMRRIISDINPITKVTINDSSRDSKRSTKKKALCSKSRSRSNNQRSLRMLPGKKVR